MGPPAASLVKRLSIFQSVHYWRLHHSDIHMYIPRVHHSDIHMYIPRVHHSDIHMYIPRIHISTEYTANDVPEMWDVVDIRQSTGDQDVLLTFHWKTV